MNILQSMAAWKQGTPFPDLKLPDGEGVMIFTSGPFCSGKGVITRRVLEAKSHFKHSVSATTRPPRMNHGRMEVHGTDYHFMMPTDFRAAVEAGEFLEAAPVHNSDTWYGTPWKSVLEPWREGFDVIGDINVDGVASIRSLDDERVRNRLATVFICAPSAREIQRRVGKRSPMPFHKMEERIESARREITLAHAYDHVIINEKLEDAVSEFLLFIDVITSPVLNPEARLDYFRLLQRKRQTALDRLDHFDFTLNPNWATEDKGEGTLCP